MFLRSANENRPYHLGPHPMETLGRDPERAAEIVMNPIEAAAPDFDRAEPFAAAVARYRDLFVELGDGPMASAQAPVPNDLRRRSIDIKGGGYFLNAAGIGVTEIPTAAWRDAADGHGHAIVVIIEAGRAPEPENSAARWIGAGAAAADALRAAEVAACIAGHIRCMGYSARAHSLGASAVHIGMLAELAGLLVRRDGCLAHPYLGEAFALAVVTTDYQLATDQPLAIDTPMEHGLVYWRGLNGAESGRERRRRAKRASHLSRYPMEQVKRVDRPTTLILDEEVPRVPKRAAFFTRAVYGDLGEKAKRERGRFANKHPFAQGMIPLIRNMVPLQDGDMASEPALGLDDPAANARAIKSLSYFLGSDLTGICEIPRYAWFSHHEDGREIPTYHRYAVVMLIDQEYETMEGASGDDWISGAQSMRAYMRGAEIAGVMADMLRGMGISARPQTNADSDVLHIPLVLWAGLGELSRIGELVLNPFVGPRFKSVVLTTDLPLEVDKPVDFGLQDFCNSCLKCARECPCDAIPWGDKVMFNGYEMWKPDVERCTRYRLTNIKGSACGRCMKTCPLNKVISADGPMLTRAASWMGVNAMWAKPAMIPLAVKLDDKLGHGRRNPAKKWWLDLEIVDGVCVEPRGVNERDLDVEKEARMDPAKQQIAYYPAAVNPPPHAPDAVGLDRKAALKVAADLETPTDAAKRR